MTVSAASIGRVVQIMGPVVDVEFSSGHVPLINHALELEFNDETRALHVVMEVAQHLGNNQVRCISMTSTDGMARGMEVVDTGGPITVPVGRDVLGRIFNVFGEPMSKGEVQMTNGGRFTAKRRHRGG